MRYPTMSMFLAHTHHALRVKRGTSCTLCQNRGARPIPYAEFTATYPAWGAL